MQASRDCLNFEYSYDLVKVAGYEEMLLVHIRRANNSSTIESGDIVDLSICSVTLRGMTGRSNGRFAPHHTGARSHSPPVSNHFEHHFFHCPHVNTGHLHSEFMQVSVVFSFPH